MGKLRPSLFKVTQLLMMEPELNPHRVSPGPELFITMPFGLQKGKAKRSPETCRQRCPAQHDGEGHKLPWQTPLLRGKRKLS